MNNRKIELKTRKGQSTIQEQLAKAGSTERMKPSSCECLPTGVCAVCNQPRYSAMWPKKEVTRTPASCSRKAVTYNSKPKSSRNKQTAAGRVRVISTPLKTCKTPLTRRQADRKIKRGRLTPLPYVAEQTNRPERRQPIPELPHVLKKKLYDQFRASGEFPPRHIAKQIVQDVYAGRICGCYLSIFGRMKIPKSWIPKVRLHRRCLYMCTNSLNNQHEENLILNKIIHPEPNPVPSYASLVRDAHECLEKSEKQVLQTKLRLRNKTKVCGVYEFSPEKNTAVFLLQRCCRKACGCQCPPSLEERNKTEAPPNQQTMRSRATEKVCRDTAKSSKMQPVTKLIRSEDVSPIAPNHQLARITHKRDGCVTSKTVHQVSPPDCRAEEPTRRTVGAQTTAPNKVPKTIRRSACVVKPEHSSGRNAERRKSWHERLDPAGQFNQTDMLRETPNRRSYMSHASPRYGVYEKDRLKPENKRDKKIFCYPCTDQLRFVGLTNTSMNSDIEGDGEKNTDLWCVSDPGQKTFEPEKFRAWWQMSGIKSPKETSTNTKQLDDSSGVVAVGTLTEATFHSTTKVSFGDSSSSLLNYLATNDMFRTQVVNDELIHYRPKLSTFKSEADRSHYYECTSTFSEKSSRHEDHQFQDYVPSARRERCTRKEKHFEDSDLKRRRDIYQLDILETHIEELKRYLERKIAKRAKAKKVTPENSNESRPVRGNSKKCPIHHQENVP